MTGASGMVGTHARRLLASRGIAVRASSRRRPADLEADASWCAWDLAQRHSIEALDEIFAGVEGVLHVGASIATATPTPDDRAEVLDANVRATLDLAEWARARDVPLVYLSSATVYADPDRDGIVESDPTGPRTLGGFYALTKLLAEETLAHFAAGGLRVAILRPSSIFGCGMDASKLVPSWLASASRGETITLTPPVDDRTNLVHASDVASAMIAALEAEAWGTYNVAGPSAPTMLEVARACTAAVGAGRVEIAPGQSPRPPRTRFGLSTARARAAFGFQPALDATAGIAQTWRDEQASRERAA